jgi:hypothetical protein
MTKNHNQHPTRCVGSSSVPVWEVYPFRLELLCSADAFHRGRARIRMKAGYTPLKQVVDAMEEQELWNTRNEEQRANDAKLIADALQATEQDRGILGI